jgi:hypothetical protein
MPLTAGSKNACHPDRGEESGIPPGRNQPPSQDDSSGKRSNMVSDPSKLMTSSQQSKEERHDENRNEYVEQNLRDSRCCRGSSAEAQDSGNDRNDEEYSSPI